MTKPKDSNQSTGIEWTNHTWNPFVGCQIVSDGCKNCYAMAQAARLERFGVPAYAGTTKQSKSGKVTWTGKIGVGSEATWNKPFTIREPSMIFVNSMSDFFNDDVPDTLRLRALNIMEKVDRHQFQILTKRPENIEPFRRRYRGYFPDNVWIGVTVENNEAAHRIRTLRLCKEIAVRFISFEPLLGPIEAAISLRGMDWIITGGESGADARNMHVSWVSTLDAMAVRHGIPHFFKQYGRPQNNPLFYRAPKGMTGAAYVKMMDPIGKGGSLLPCRNSSGRPVKEWPEGRNPFELRLVG